MSEKTSPETIYKQAIAGVRILLYMKTRTNSLALNTKDIDNLLGNLGDNPVFYETRKNLDQSRRNNTMNMGNLNGMMAIISHDLATVLKSYDKLFESFESRLKASKEEFYAIRRQ